MTSYSHGQIRSFFHRDTHLDAQRPVGHWVLVYVEEMRKILPGVNLEWNRHRATYWIQILRDEEGNALEMRVYSSTYKPIFRLNIALPDPASVMDWDLADWWKHQTRPTSHHVPVKLSKLYPQPSNPR